MESKDESASGHELVRRLRLCEQAAEKMRAAQALLDEAEAHRAAALLDQALHAVPGVPWVAEPVGGLEFEDPFGSAGGEA